MSTKKAAPAAKPQSDAEKIKALKDSADFKKMEAAIKAHNSLVSGFKDTNLDGLTPEQITIYLNSVDVLAAEIEAAEEKKLFAHIKNVAGSSKRFSEKDMAKPFIIGPKGIFSKKSKHHTFVGIRKTTDSVFRQRKRGDRVKKKYEK